MNTRVKVAILCVMVAIVVGLLLLDWKSPPQKGKAGPTPVARENDEFRTPQSDTTVVEEFDVKPATTPSTPASPTPGSELTQGTGPAPDSKGFEEIKIGGKGDTEKSATPEQVKPSEPSKKYEPPTAKPEPRQYVVEEGDSYYKIAKKVYGDGNKANVIAKANPQYPANRLKVKAVLTIPPVEPTVAVAPEKGFEPNHDPAPVAGGKTYKVQENDSYWKIAEKVYGNGTKCQKIMDVNKDKVAQFGKNLKSGWTINLPE